MDAGLVRLRASVEECLWPLVETFLCSHDVAGLAVAVVREGEVVSRGFGSVTSAPVRRSHPRRCSTWPQCPSRSSPTAIVSLATAREAGEPVLDLDAPIVAWVPEFTLADGRAREVTARGLLSHSSGLRTSRTTAGMTRSWATTRSAGSLVACRAGGCRRNPARRSPTPMPGSSFSGCCCLGPPARRSKTPSGSRS